MFESQIAEQIYNKLNDKYSEKWGVKHNGNYWWQRLIKETLEQAFIKAEEEVKKKVEELKDLLIKHKGKVQKFGFILSLAQTMEDIDQIFSDNSQEVNGDKVAPIPTTLDNTQKDKSEVKKDGIK